PAQTLGARALCACSVARSHGHRRTAIRPDARAVFAHARPRGELPHAPQAQACDVSGLIKGVLFDLDGTLLDTAQDFHESLNQLRAEEALAPLSFETVRAQVSHGGHALVRL